MAFPNAPLFTLRPDLGTLLSFDLMMSRRGFIGNKIFPVVEVDAAAGSFGRIPIESLLQRRNLVRAADGGYSRQNWNFVPDYFKTQEYGAEDPVDDNNRNVYGGYFKAEQIAAMRVQDAVLRGYESRVANQLFNTATYNGVSLTAAVSTPWSNKAASTPISDTAAAKANVYNAYGLRANTMVLDYIAFLNLQQNADLINRIKFSGLMNPDTEDVTAVALAQAFGIKQVLVGDAQQNGANEGQAAALAPIWSSGFCWVGYCAETEDIAEPCVGRTFHWDGDGSTINGTMESYRDEKVRGDVVRCRHQTEEKMLVPQAGFLLSNIT